MFRRYFSFLAFLGFSLWVLLSFAGDIRFFVQPQQQKPSYELKVGARNSTIRNIGSFQVDSAFIFPKREAKDTLDGKTKALRRKGAFFYDSVTHIVWFYDGQHFRRADSSIYNSDGVIEKVRQVDIRGKDKAYLYFKNGSVHVDTLLIRKKQLGNSQDSFLVRYKDTVRYIPKDSLWNIYTNDDSIRNTKKTEDKRTVYLNAKKLVFELGNKTNGGQANNKGADSGKIGIGQKKPVYTLDISTKTALKEPSASGTTSVIDDANDYDSVAVRIAHNVIEGSDKSAQTRYGLVITENSNKAHGRSALGFQNGGNGTNNNIPFMKARLWTEVGNNAKRSKFGIDVADKDKQIQNRLIIDSVGSIGIDTLETGNSKFRIAGKGLNFSDGIVNISNPNQDNYLRIQAGKTEANYSGIWLTEHNNVYGWKMVNNANSDKFQLFKTYANGHVEPTRDTVFEIKRTGVTVFNVDVGSGAPGTTYNTSSNPKPNPDSVALLIKHSVWESGGKGGYTYGLMLFDSSNKAKGRASIGFLNGGHNVGTLATTSSASTVETRDARSSSGPSSAGIYVVSEGGEARSSSTTTNKDAFPAFLKARLWSEVGSGGKQPRLGIDVADSNRRIQNRLIINHLGYVGINEENPAHLLDVKNGRTALDTLLIRKKIKGMSSDSLLVMFKDTVRYILKDSLWNIYTGDDSLRKTGADGKRTVYLNAKKLVFELGNKDQSGQAGNNGADSGKIGIGQKNPVYTLDISTKTALGENAATAAPPTPPAAAASSSPGATTATTTTNDYDSVAVRIAHNVTEGSNSGDESARAQARYGLVITENSNKAYGRSALGFQNGGKETNNNIPFMKARLWTQIGSNGAKEPKFGIDVADSNKALQTRIVVDKLGRVGMGVENPTDRLHIRSKKGRTYPDKNFIRIEAPGSGAKTSPSSTNRDNTIDDVSGLWLTEYNNGYGWAVLYNAADHGWVIEDNRNKGDVGRGDYFSIERTKETGTGTRNEFIIGDPGVSNLPVLRIPGSNEGTSRGNITPAVVIAPYEGVGSSAVQLVVHGKIKTGGIVDFSDSILKKDVHNIDQVYGRNIINSLRPVTYHMRSDLELQGKQDTTSRDSSSKQLLNYGFIAQEVERVMPDIVEKSQFRLFHDQPKFIPDSVKSMNYSAIIAPLVANVQLLNKDLEKAERKLATSEQENAKLHSQVEKLQGQVEELQELFRRYIGSTQGKGQQPSTKLER